MRVAERACAFFDAETYACFVRAKKATKEYK